ncbi:MAG: hypothetical protein IPO21_16745 [Bacteroidales bacterium]|nr:hypothetical protein [Bacteroidales bacterium]
MELSFNPQHWQVWVLILEILNSIFIKKQTHTIPKENITVQHKKIFIYKKKQMKKFLLIVLCTLALFSASAQTINEKRIKELKKEIRHASRPEDSSLKNRFFKREGIAFANKKISKGK